VTDIQKSNDDHLGPHEVARHFSLLWRREACPDVAAFLARSGTVDARQVREILEIDQWERWQRGQRPPAEDYLRLLPTGASEEDCFGLIYGEFLIRQNLNETPTLAEYAGRFPLHETRLREQLEFQRIVLVGETVNQPISEPSTFETPDQSSNGFSPPHHADGYPTLAGFMLQRELGRGGMGVVYQARDERLGRWVALKMMRFRDYADPESRNRFRTEAEVVARLQHPNIVQIFEVGEQEGQLFLSLEFVAGGNLAQHAAGRPQPIRKAAELVVVLARAIQHAHEHGIIHRDLKPANVLLDAEGTPKITDFGLAKRLDLENDRTASGVIVGTASYMAPEQASGKSRAVTPAADVYALGTILYELLTGRPPFQGESPMETILQVLHSDPVPPARLVPKVPRDLECICLKCLEKEPGRRYATAPALADDLGRFLRGEPIQARPAPAWERLWKWARRRPAVAALTLAIIAVTFTGFALVTWQWRRADQGWQSADDERVKADQARREAETLARTEADARREAQRISTRLLIDQGLNFCEQRDYGQGALTLIRALEVAADSPDDAQHIRQLLDGCRSYLHRPLAIFAQSSPVRAAALSPDGKVVVTGTADGVVQLWQAEEGLPLGPPLPLPRKGAVRIAQFSPKGRHLLIVSSDTDVCVWDTSTRELHSQFSGHTAAITCAAFSNDGTSVLTGSEDRTARLWASGTGKPLFPPFVHDDPVVAVAFSPAVGVVASSAGAVARLWDSKRGRPIGLPMRHDGAIRCLAFGQLGSTIVTAGDDNTARLWYVPSGKSRGLTYRHRGPITTIGFHPRFTMFLTASLDRTMTRWHTTTDKTVTIPYQLVEAPRSAAHSPDGDSILVSFATTAEVWDSRGLNRRLGEPLRHRGTIHAAAFSRDGRRILTASEDGTAILWQTPLHHPVDRVVEIPAAVVKSIACSGDGRTLLVVTENGTARCFDADTGKPRGDALQAGGAFAQAIFSPDDRSILTVGTDRTACLCDAQGGALVRKISNPADGISAAAFMPDGRPITAGDGVVQLWDAQTTQKNREVFRYQGEIHLLAVSPDGQALATAHGDHTAALWDIATGKRIGEPLGHARKVQALAFSPNGRIVATAADDHSAALWDRSSGKQLRRMRHDAPVVGLAFSPDGATLAMVGRGTLRFWDVASGRPLGEVRRHTSGLVKAVAFCPDGKSVLTAIGGDVWRWQAPRPRSESIEHLKLWVQVVSGMEMDDAGTIHYLDPATWQDRHRRLQQQGGPPGD
jgi:WD40 repeat protein/tRNA A-37 threonylcarbamoyl transferase component Bud32